MRTKATVLSFFLVFSLYLVYGWALVPLVLPNRSVENNPSTDSFARNNVTREEIEPYLSLFPEDGWERDSNKEIHLLQFGQTIVLFGKDTNKGKSLELEPCTILMLPNDLPDYYGEEEFKEKMRQSVVVRTPGKAEITFDKDFDVSKMPLPNVTGGRLWGKVTIKSCIDNSGQQNDFSLETENVEIKDESGVMSIVTKKDVRFTFGPHSGVGTDLTLNIAQSDPAKPQTSNEVNSAEFQKIKWLKFVFPEENSANVTTMDVACQGNFKFTTNPVEQGWTASFFQNVVMSRNNPDKTIDQLTAHEVHLTLQPKEHVATVKTSQFDRLEPVIFVAWGKPGENAQPAIPARLSVKHGGNVTLVGDEIFHNLRENRLSLSTNPNTAVALPVVEIIVADQYAITNEQCIEYTLGQNGAFGKFAAKGKGGMTGKVGEGASAKEISLVWNEMRMAPSPAMKDQIVLILDNGISAKMTGFGTMTANQLELHYNFVPAGNQKSNVMLDHAVVKDNVLFESTTGTCRVKQQLNIFFTNVGSDGKTLHSRWMPQILTEGPPTVPGMEISAIQQPIQQVQYLQPLSPTQPVPLYTPSAAPIAAPVRNPHSLPSAAAPAPKGSVETQNLLGIKSSPGGGKFDMVADLMKMRITMQNGLSSAKDVVFEGNVRLKETAPGSAANGAVEIVGDTVRIWNPADPDTAIEIAGQASTSDAIFKGKGVELRAKELNISKADNKFWSPGPGRLVADTAQIKTPGIPAGNANANNNKLVVEWNKEMRCDGQVLQFIGMQDRNGNRVKVLYQTTTMWCNEMQMTLNRKVMFFDDQSPVEPKAVQIQCVHDVHMQNRQLDAAGKQKSINKATVAKVQYEVERDYFRAQGPGELNSIFLGSAQGFDGVNTQRNPAGAQSETLNYMAVWFSDSMQGTLLGNSKNVDIQGRRIEVAYYPATGWEDVIGIENLAAARQKGYTLECDRLRIEEMPVPSNPSQSSMELTASETAVVEGSGIYGRAKTIKYNQAKEIVSLDGNATIQVKAQGQSLQQGSVESIRYNIKTRSVELIQAGGMNIN
jgi:hypothetical protein